MIRAAVICALMATPAAAQVATSSGNGVIVRGLDKVSGRVTDVEIGVGQVKQLGRISITLRECRYPKGNRSGDAFAYLTVVDPSDDAPVFTGWMIASSPALNAMDHARYDVWVMRCTTP